MDRRTAVSRVFATLPLAPWLPLSLQGGSACPTVVIDPCTFATASDPAAAAGDALTAAVKRLEATGGTVVLLPGRIKLKQTTRMFGATPVTAGLWIPSNTAIIGTGPATVLTSDATVGVLIANSNFKDGNRNILLRDLVLEGNPKAGSPPGYFSMVTADQYRHHGILLVNTKYFRLENLSVTGVLGSGFYLANLGTQYQPQLPELYCGPSCGQVIACLASRCGSYGFWLNGSGTRDITITDCRAEQIGGGDLMPSSFSGGHAFLLDSNVLFCQLRACTVSEPPPPKPGHGIFLTGACSYNQITDCLIDGGLDGGVALGSGSRMNRVSNCHVQNVEGHSAYLVSAPESGQHPLGNQITNCSADAFCDPVCLVTHAQGTQIANLMIGAVRRASRLPMDDGSLVLRNAPDTVLSGITYLTPTQPEMAAPHAISTDSVSMRLTAQQLSAINALPREADKGVHIVP